MVSVPPGVILKTVPPLLAPPDTSSHRSSRRWLAPARVRAVAVSVVEAVQRGQRAAWGDFEDRATASVSVAAGSACVGCPVEVPVGALHQPGIRVRRQRSSVESKSCRASSACRWGDFEDRPATTTPPQCCRIRQKWLSRRSSRRFPGPPVPGSPSVCPVETNQSREGLCGRDDRRRGTRHCDGEDDSRQ